MILATLAIGLILWISSHVGLTLIISALLAVTLYHMDGKRVKSSARSAGRGAKRASTALMFILSAIFIITIVFEISGDGISVAVPFAKYVSTAGDYVNNGLQILIFSWLANKVGGRYSHSGRVQYNNNNNNKPGGRGGGGNHRKPVKSMKGRNFGDQV